MFTSIFFISVGMLLDASFFYQHIWFVLGATLLVLVIKGLIAGLDTLCIGYPIRPAIIVGLALCQVGEFSFVLAKVGLDDGLLSQDKYQLFLAASILTMAATPFLINFSPKFASYFAKLLHGKSAEEEDTAPEAAATLSDHLIVVGYGVGGRLLTRAAKMAGINYVVLEMNPDTVRH